MIDYPEFGVTVFVEYTVPAGSTCIPVLFDVDVVRLLYMLYNFLMLCDTGSLKLSDCDTNQFIMMQKLKPWAGFY